MSLYNKDRDKFSSFDSPTQFVDYLNENVPARLIERGVGYDESFFGVDFDEACSNAINGTSKNVAQAEKLINEMQELNIFSAGVPIMTRAVQGYVPNVPAVIQGHPEAFFTRTRDENQNMNSPIAVYVETSLSASIKDREIINRGVAALALCMALSNIRPVRLYAVYAGVIRSNGGCAVDLGSTPFNLSVATWMLTDKAMPRRLGFHYLMSQDKIKYSSVPWCWGMVPPAKSYCDNMRAAFSMSEDDIFIPGGHAHDTLMLTNPVQWVKQMVTKHGGHIEE